MRRWARHAPANHNSISSFTAPCARVPVIHVPTSSTVLERSSETRNFIQSECALSLRWRFLHRSCPVLQFVSSSSHPLILSSSHLPSFFPCPTPSPCNLKHQTSEITYVWGITASSSKNSCAVSIWFPNVALSHGHHHLERSPDSARCSCCGITFLGIFLSPRVRRLGSRTFLGVVDGEEEKNTAAQHADESEPGEDDRSNSSTVLTITQGCATVLAELRQQRLSISIIDSRWTSKVPAVICGDDGECERGGEIEDG